MSFPSKFILIIDNRIELYSDLSMYLFFLKLLKQSEITSTWTQDNVVKIGILPWSGKRYIDSLIIETEHRIVHPKIN